MFKSIIASLIARILSQPQTFEGAIAAFNKIIDNLQLVATKAALEGSKALAERLDAAERLAKAQADHADAVAEAVAKEALAKADYARAQAAAEKIKALIGSV